MRICQVGSSLHDWGGIERYLLYLCQALSDRGHEVTCVVPQDSPLDAQIRSPKVHISLRRQFQLSLLPEFLKFFRANQFDVVNIHFSPDYIIPAMAAKIAKQPCRVATRHVLVPWNSTKTRRYSRLFNHFVGVSNAVGQMLMDGGITENRVSVAEPGCPALVTSKNYQPDGFKAGFFGRIVAEKGVKMLVEAAPLCKPVEIHAFGSGPLLAELKNQNSGVRFHGRVENVADAMNSVSCVLVPSLWDEAFGFVALEAMSLGKPVIATRSGNLPELVIPGETGILVDKGDSQGLAGAICQLAADADEAARLGRAGLDMHRARYLVSHFGERVEAAYLRAIG